MKRRIRGPLPVMILALVLLPGTGPQTRAGGGRSRQQWAAILIMVNRTMNTEAVYGLDESGYYTVPVKAMVCSVGRGGSITFRGAYGGRLLRTIRHPVLWKFSVPLRLLFRRGPLDPAD